MQGVIVEALFFGFSWLQSLIDSEPLSYGDVEFGIFMIIGDDALDRPRRRGVPGEQPR